MRLGIALTIPFLLILNGCAQISDYTQPNRVIAEKPDPYEGLVCMHDFKVSEADIHNHTCEQFETLKIIDTYEPKYTFDKTNKVEFDPQYIKLLKAIVETIETRNDNYYQFNLKENGFEWAQEIFQNDEDAFLQLEYDILHYCAGEYQADIGFLGRLSFCRDDVYSYVGLENFEEMRETLALSREEGKRQAFIQDKIKEVVNSLPLNNYTIHDMKIIHDYICDNATYQANDATTQSGYNNSLYIFFTEGKIACGAYAGIFQAICNYVGIDVEYVSGCVTIDGIFGHAWNSIDIDGTTYYIDCTWDDDNENNSIIYKYFLTTKSSGFTDEEVIAYLKGTV